MAYSLATSLAGEALLSGFNWFDGSDPTHGFVSYQNRPNAEAKGLFSVDENTGVVRLGVDHTNTYRLDEGRPSLRLESKESFNHGLFIADFLHMPPSQCGMWPAFWMYGDNWPTGGEIDIIEGVNTAHQNSIAAHTTNGCTLASASDEVFTGIKQRTDCATGNDNVGCGFGSPANATTAYGDGFNAINGGVYAVDWNHKHIKVWHFERGRIPKDIEAKTPDPTKWKAPVAVFGGSSCDVDSYFKNMRLVINTNFCGDWGNAVWGKTDQCNAFASTCSDYVAKSPQAFANAYWDVRYIDTYQFSNSTRSPKPRVKAGYAALAGNTTLPTNTTLATANMTISAINMTISANNMTISATNTSAAAINGTATGTGGLSSGIAASFINLPSATQAPANPAKIGKYAYLGCFGSRTGFQTFTGAKESGDMSLEMCVELCDGKTFAGVFEGKCLCAEALDADTRAMGVEEGAVCDHACPGNDEEYCGGIRESPAMMAKNSTKMPEQQRFTNVTRTSYKRAPAGRIRRRKLPSTYLLSVYGDVTEPVPPAELARPPPPMASGATGTGPALMVTATAYRTVYPLQSAATVYRTVYPLQSAATVYWTVYPSQSAAATSGKPIKYGAKPKFTYKDLPKTAANSPQASGAPADNPQASGAPADNPQASGAPADNPTVIISVFNSPGASTVAASNPEVTVSVVGSPKASTLAANPDNPGSAASYNHGPLSLAAKPPGASGNPAAAAPSIVTVYIKECDSKQGKGSGATAEASPTAHPVPPQVPQPMAAGNRMSKPLTVEPDSKTAPSVPRRAPQNSRNARSPDGPGSPGGAGNS